MKPWMNKQIPNELKLCFNLRKQVSICSASINSLSPKYVRVENPKMACFRNMKLIFVNLQIRRKKSSKNKFSTSKRKLIRLISSLSTQSSLNDQKRKSLRCWKKPSKIHKEKDIMENFKIFIRCQTVKNNSKKSSPKSQATRNISRSNVNRRRKEIKQQRLIMLSRHKVLKEIGKECVLIAGHGSNKRWCMRKI